MCDEVAGNIHVYFSGVVVLNTVVRLLSSLQRETVLNQTEICAMVS